MSNRLLCQQLSSALSDPKQSVSVEVDDLYLNEGKFVIVPETFDLNDIELNTNTKFTILYDDGEMDHVKLDISEIVTLVENSSVSKKPKKRRYAYTMENANRINVYIGNKKLGSWTEIIESFEEHHKNVS